MAAKITEKTLVPVGLAISIISTVTWYVASIETRVHAATMDTERLKENHKALCIKLDSIKTELSEIKGELRRIRR